MSSNKEIRIGVDIGGTFTDIVMVGEGGSVFVRKVSSTPDDYGRGILQGLSEIIDDVGAFPSQIDSIVHATTVATNAFSQGSPNNKDPVFINLRIKSKDSNIYHAVASSIDATLKSVIYNDKITKETKLKDVMGKAVIIIDKTVEYDYKKYSSCKEGAKSCYDLTKYMNLESGSEYLNLYHYTDLLGHAKKPVLLKDDNIHTTSKNMKMASPDIVVNKANPSYKEFIVNHGCQNLLCQFQIVDENFINYEEFFNNMNSGIVPLSSALKYFTK